MAAQIGLLEELTAADLPCIFGRYELQAILGEGGMARVFRAELCGPAGFRKPVALKVIKSEVTGHVSQDEVGDLIREARIGGRLKHPHVVDVYELGEIDGQLFISMEFVEGVTLDQLVRSHGALPPSVVLQIGAAIVFKGALQTRRMKG